MAKASPERLELLRQHVEHNVAFRVREWFKEASSTGRDLGDQTVDELRKYAQRLGVPSYFKMTKAELLSEISKCPKAS